MIGDVTTARNQAAEHQVQSRAEGHPNHTSAATYERVLLRPPGGHEHAFRSPHQHFRSTSNSRLTLQRRRHLRCATNKRGLRESSQSAPSNLDLSAVIRLAHGKVKQTEGVSGQNRITRGKVVEPYPSIANPDHTWRHIVSYVGPCSKLSPLVVDLDRLTIGELTRICVDR